LRISPKHRRTALFAAAGLLVLAVIVLIGVRSSRPSAREIAFSELLSAIAADRIAHVVIENESVTAVDRDGARLRASVPPGYAAASPTFIPGLMERGCASRSGRADRRCSDTARSSWRRRCSGSFA